MKGTIEIRIQNPDKSISTLPVKADIYGQWAVHYEYVGQQGGSYLFCDEAPYKLWQITHAPSGMMVRNNFEKRRDAQAVVESLLTYPVTFTDPYEITVEERQKLFNFLNTAASSLHRGVTWTEWTRAMEITA